MAECFPENGIWISIEWVYQGANCTVNPKGCVPHYIRTYVYFTYVILVVCQTLCQLRFCCCYCYNWLICFPNVGVVISQSVCLVCCYLQVYVHCVVICQSVCQVCCNVSFCVRYVVMCQQVCCWCCNPSICVPDVL